MSTRLADGAYLLVNRCSGGIGPSLVFVSVTAVHVLCVAVEGLASQVQWRAFLKMTEYLVIVYIHGTGGRGNRDSVHCLGDLRFEFLPFGSCFGTSLRSHEHVSKYGEDN